MNHRLLFDSLLDMQATVIAQIDDQGLLMTASRGFFRLLPQGINLKGDVSRFFVQPGFSYLKNLPDQQYSGLMTIGTFTGATATIIGKFYRDDDAWVLLGERNFDADAAVEEQLAGLISQLSQSQRELSAANRKLTLLEQQASQRAMTDVLTGLFNRRHFDDMIVAELHRAQREHAPFGIIMCDLDKFKSVNDTYGHDIGDVVLKRFAEVIGACLRKYDIATRYGGEEFVVLVPGAQAAELIAIAERIRKAIAQETFAPGGFRITASFGLACYTDDDTPATLFKRADGALYEAKEGGRNRVVIADQQAGQPP